MNKKNKLIIIFLASAILLFGLAKNTPAYREEVLYSSLFSNQTAKMSNGKNITIQLSTDELSINAKIENGPEFIITNNSCGARDLWIVCFNGKEFGNYHSSQPSEGKTYTTKNK